MDMGGGHDSHMMSLLQEAELVEDDDDEETMNEDMVHPNGQPSPTIDNEGKNCWDHCNKLSGQCDWCGGEGCCKAGDSSGGCNRGCDGHHCCVALFRQRETDSQYDSG